MNARGFGISTPSRCCLRVGYHAESAALANSNVTAHEKALAAAGDTIAFALWMPAPLKSIADQVIRSANSVPANLAEGHGRSGRDLLHPSRNAYTSAKEVESHMRLLQRAGVINTSKAEFVLEILDLFAR